MTTRAVILGDGAAWATSHNMTTHPVTNPEELAATLSPSDVAVIGELRDLGTRPAQLAASLRMLARPNARVVVVKEDIDTDRWQHGQTLEAMAQAALAGEGARADKLRKSIKKRIKGGKPWGGQHNKKANGRTMLRIRQMRHKGMSIREIAERVKMGKSRVAQLLRA